MCIRDRPGAGKTETAKFFMQFIPKESRVITIEDSLEIHYPEINAGAAVSYTHLDVYKRQIKKHS